MKSSQNVMSLSGQLCASEGRLIVENLGIGETWTINFLIELMSMKLNSIEMKLTSEKVFHLSNHNLFILSKDSILSHNKFVFEAF